MFVVNPDPFLLPTYRISPFRTEDMARNANLPEDDFASTYFDNRFGKGNWAYTFNGREAIRLALEHYNLQSNDLVTILTTSENFYISSCVTKEIEAVCQWNREILPETKIIFVNHEFGYPHPDIEKLAATGLPIIEDCCTTFFSQDTAGKLGQYGDFSVYSFPKFFPIQIGGLLVSNGNHPIKNSRELDEKETSYIQNAISNFLKNEAEILQKRKQNWDYAVHQFSKMGFTTRFETQQNIVPSALLLNNNGIIEDLNMLKLFLNQHGIQNSVFYGEDAFFIPIHQSLTKSDLDYFSYVFTQFMNPKSDSDVR
ncbi:DegT/DnrJ/EryC1/StrS family aminotransferase [Flavobacterium sp.]|uniref:DegT/DnrJ/EryC1/StrS family aminotransferase n=1 Tax=Flavobacterium sp. TaxID=239 RepID=UPI00286B27BA|nr:DegT/DnrJ/EryC1/StrS family aminotransferase [Flavobacterium sp.]